MPPGAGRRQAAPAVSVNAACRPLPRAPRGRTIPRVLDAAAHYEDGKRTAGPDLTIREAIELRRRERGFVWIALVDPTADELQQLCDGVGLHELAMADILSPHERPKLDDYEGRAQLMILRTVHRAGEQGRVRFGELAVFVTDGLVVSARKGGRHAQGTARAALERRPDLLANGVSAVLWAVVHKVLGDIRPVVDAIDERLITVENDVFADDGDDLTERVYRLRQDVAQLHRTVHPMLEPLRLIERGTYPLLAPMRHYLSDASDAARLLNEDILNDRFRLDSVLDANLALIAQRQNESVRKISGWAAIAAVPTLIAGIWGMNFADMPGLDWRWGFPACLVIMVLIALALRAALRRANWM
jgi:magnesium transporter